MTRDQIIQWARKAGATPYTSRHYPDRPTHTFNPEQLERFAALVAAAEREACAQVADVEAAQWAAYSDGRVSVAGVAAAIRARGQT